MVQLLSQHPALNAAPRAPQRLCGRSCAGVMRTFARVRVHPPVWECVWGGGCRVRLRARVCVDAHARTRDHVCARQCGVTACASEAHVALRARACVRVWDRANRSPLDARRSEEHAEREALCVHARVYELERDRQRWLHAAYFCARAERPSVSTASRVRALSPTSEEAALRLHARERERALLLARPTHPPTHRAHACARARARALALRDRHRRAAPHLHGEVVRERRGNATRPHAADGLEAVLLDPADDARLGARRVAGEVAHSAGRARGAAQGQTQGGQVCVWGRGGVRHAQGAWWCVRGGVGGRVRAARPLWPAAPPAVPAGSFFPEQRKTSLPSARQNACDRDEFM